jgi:hypothetical protein
MRKISSASATGSNQQLQGFDDNGRDFQSAFAKTLP